MRIQRIGLGLTILVAVSAVGSAIAQTNIEKLKQMKVASADLNIPPVPQTGKNADAISAESRTHQAAARIQDCAYMRSCQTRGTWQLPRPPTCCSLVRARPRCGP